jgi:hypothetical protein
LHVTLPPPRISSLLISSISLASHHFLSFLVSLPL